jgi:hypothetical protein
MEGKDLYLLDRDSLTRLNTALIEQATLATHDYGGGQFFLMSLAQNFPNLIGAAAYAGEWGGGFIFLGLLHAVPAGLGTLINSLSTCEIKYPSQVSDLSSLSIYARFPQGLPDGIDPADLTSKPLQHR